MSGGDGADDGQTEPVAILMVGSRAVGGLEGLEELLDLFRWYSRPIIHH